MQLRLFQSSSLIFHFLSVQSQSFTYLPRAKVVFIAEYNVLLMRGPYRIQNCFSTISAKILVNHYYFRGLWRILYSSAILCESPKFLPHVVTYLLLQLSWLLVACLTLNFGDFHLLFSPHLVTNPSSRTLKYKFRAKKFWTLPLA